MKILVLSDLHHERHDIGVRVPESCRIGDAADVVVLAGDIDSSCEGIYWASQTFPNKPVIYVAGNHEFYGRFYERTIKLMRQAARDCGVHFLERNAVEIDGYRFLGATLWTDFEVFGSDEETVFNCMDESMAFINDFRLISTERPRKHYHPSPHPERKFYPEDAREIHQETVAWLEAEFARGSPERTIVVSHHAPHRNSIQPRYATDLTTGAFASDLSRLMGRCALWIHGHMHSASDYEVNGTRVVSNPRGYVMWDDSNENRDFKPDLVVQV